MEPSNAVAVDLQWTLVDCVAQDAVKEPLDDHGGVALRLPDGIRLRLKADAGWEAWLTEKVVVDGVCAVCTCDMCMHAGKC